MLKPSHLQFVTRNIQRNVTVTQPFSFVLGSTPHTVRLFVSSSVSFKGLQRDLFLNHTRGGFFVFAILVLW